MNFREVVLVRRQLHREFWVTYSPGQVGANTQGPSQLDSVAGVLDVGSPSAEYGQFLLGTSKHCPVREGGPLCGRRKTEDL